MEDVTLPSVGASFKKWVCCTPILPKALAHFLNFQKKISKKKISKKLKQSSVEGQASIRGRRATVGRRPRTGARASAKKK
jgi:hypothetical protein